MIKCFVIDGVTFIGKLEYDSGVLQTVSEVAAITMDAEGIMGIGAISPYLDLKTEPEFDPFVFDRALVIFAPAEPVLEVYKAYREKLEKARAGEPEEAETVDPTQEANDPA